MYESKADLPESLKMDLPEEAQTIYLEAYNEAYENYDADDESGETGRASVATRKAWATVKRDYVKNEETGNWYRHGEEPVADESDEDESILDKITDAL